MSNFEKLLLKTRRQNAQRAKRAGRKEGRKEGKREERNGIIKVLFKNNMSAEEISEKTGIKLSEILKIVN